MPSRIEKDIENSAIRVVKRRYPGTITRKMNGAGFRGWPDRLFLVPGLDAFWIEYKRPGLNLTKLQIDIVAELRNLGQRVYICASTEETLDAIRAEELSKNHG